jgi:hypothetical protein
LGKYLNRLFAKDLWMVNEHRKYTPLVIMEIQIKTIVS